MTEAATEATTLTKNALYSQYGVIMFAITTERLVTLQGDRSTAVEPNDATALVADPGTDEWVDRMVRFRNSAASIMATLRTDNEKQATHLEDLGEALRQEAIDRSWCGEYNSFAEDWGLPRTSTDFEVTVTVTIKASSEEEALGIIRDSVTLSDYSEGVVSGPEFEASEA